MKSSSIILASLLLVLTIACSDTEADKEMILAGCSTIANSKVLSATERDSLQIFSDVYLYKSKIYILCVCHPCDKLYMAVNCEQTPLCEDSEDCMDNFDKKATYLFSVE